MRTWRVGTFSMGASLIFLGLFLFFSKFLSLDLAEVLMAWWPVLLVVLGVEILVYLFLSRQEQPILKYDFLSIFFVGLIGTAGIVFAVLSSAGVMGKVEEVMAREVRSYDLPAFSYQTDESIKRVVIRSVGYDMTVEATDSKEVSMFGTYRIESAKKTALLKNAKDIVTTNQKGDTLYLNFKMLPDEMGLFDSQGVVAATVLVPSHVKLEVVGSNDSLSLKPRTLANDWDIESSSAVAVDVMKNSNMTVKTVGVDQLNGEDWKITEEPKGEELDSAGQKSAEYQSGDGKYLIHISNAYEVKLNTNQ
ncbi:hypothetical protein L1999_02390 [Neobacillus drentensis]|uniref:hypothetical protein n=1 Tax=Neobacillus drentensis TaxID=220684 RepID=UPI001F20E4C2|nr:hypothetical protein [Neobacillus drentensis]ULT57453.1 hypothetical protein L1999_02390 [Neobacillus drentensis]